MKIFPYLGHHAPVNAKVSYGLIDDFHTSCLADNVDIDQVWLVNTSNSKGVFNRQKKGKTNSYPMFTIIEITKEMYLLKNIVYKYKILTEIFETIFKERKNQYF